MNFRTNGQGEENQETNKRKNQHITKNITFKCKQMKEVKMKSHKKKNNRNNICVC